jgi:hypothetical protein
METARRLLSAGGCWFWLRENYISIFVESPQESLLRQDSIALKS